MAQDLTISGVCIRREVVAHPLLGDANAIEHAGRTITFVSVIDWDDPQEIPVIAEPGRLPPGAGGPVLNELARRAQRPLRYAGPYPTPALYRTLLRSFRASADEATFTHDLMKRMLRLARDPIDVEFAPAPHERVENAHGHVEIRDGIEAAVLAGTRYERDGEVTRLVADHCEVWFGDSCYARVATLSPRGELVAGPHAPPALASAVIGKTFPPELRDALAELVADGVPPPLADDAVQTIQGSTIAWADLGARPARATATGFEVHAALWDRIAPQGLARVALAVAAALAPVVTSTLVAQIAAQAR